MRSQIILTAPEYIKIGEYTTKSGQKKNRYKKNPESKPFVNKRSRVKVIQHK